MAKIYIQGGTKLEGEVKASGAKNAALAIIPACVLAPFPCVLENVPRISDVENYCSILREINAQVEWSEDGHLNIDTSSVSTAIADSQLAQAFRASYYLLGAFLARFGEAAVALPGGCDIGLRPIDQHIKGFEALGAKVAIEGGLVRITADRLVGNTIYFDIVSVGATINVMLAACGAEGTTVIENCAREPEIVDVANFLNSIGFTVRGAGTDTIRVYGGRAVRGTVHPVIPDRIEAGTLLIAGVATGGRVKVTGIIPKHLEPLVAKLREMGANVIEGEDFIIAENPGLLQGVDIKTLPYPGFPTDLQPQMAVLLLTAQGTSIVTESIFSNRLRYVDELRRMGARIKVEGNTAVIEGGQQLQGASVQAFNLRAGAALLIAGMCAEGETVVDGIYHIDRGYEDIEDKLRKLGARISRR